LWCNDKIDGLGIMSSPTCRLVNVIDIFKPFPDGCRHSHDYRNFASHIHYHLYRSCWGFMVLNATFNNISIIAWWSVLLVEENADLSQVIDKL
jgi:hypothetical protein